MKSIKCNNCGLVNFADSTNCKRCKSDLKAVSSGVSNQQTFTTPPNKLNARSATQSLSVQPSFISIVKNDYGALFGAGLPIILWGLFIATNVFGISISRRGNALPTDGSDSTFIYIAIVGTVIGIALLIWRVNTFKQVFANGIEAIGQITSVSFFKDRGRIEYSYRLNGQSYQSGSAIMKNKKTQSFQDGNEIELIVDRSNPGRAFIKTLYS